ncbi:MAG: sirohydrochlorin chelatase [Chloroflexales bacterium]|nr:sirohydrochlorin chelatase [Chloroflexales bacterium]
MNPERSALLLVGHGTADPAGQAEYERLAALLSDRLMTFVQPCFLELADPPIAQAIDECVTAGFQHIVALPLLLGAASHQKNDIPTALNLARARWPEVSIYYGTPLGAQYTLVCTLAERVDLARAAANTQIPPEETALAIIGRGSRDPDSNAEVARIARLLWEGRGYGWVEYGFYGLSQPDTAVTLDRCVALGAKQVVVLPYLLFTGRIHQRIGILVEAAQQRHREIAFLLAEHLGEHPGVIAAIRQRYEEALNDTATMNCDVCKYRQLMPGFTAEFGLPQTSDHHHGMRGVSHHHGAPAANRILPPRYRGGVAVSAAPMGAAPLVYDAEGRVAWDQIWGGDDPNSPFCELALAGGPPHRGELLEPASPDTVAADPEAYARVVAELVRGLRLVTSLTVVTDRAPGWVGLVCTSEEMALWLLRAIVVENISVRRERNVLFLPAGPNFHLESEIKNVITAVAKTHHYWQEHMQGGQP